MNIKHFLFSAIPLAAALAIIPASQAATVTATLQDPAEGFSTSTDRYLYAYRWNTTDKTWDYEDGAYSPDTDTGEHSLNLRKGRYYFQSYIWGNIGDEYFNAEEYYDNTQTFAFKQEIILATDDVLDLGVIDFDIEIPELQISSILFAKNSNIIPSAGGTVKAKLQILNTTGEEQIATIWGIHEHYSDDDYMTYVQNMVTNKAITKKLAPGMNTVKYYFSLPEEASDEETSVKFYVGSSPYASNVHSYSGNLYKGDENFRSSTPPGPASQPAKRRIPKTISEDGKVLSWKE